MVIRHTLELKEIDSYCSIHKQRSTVGLAVTGFFPSARYIEVMIINFE